MVLSTNVLVCNRQDSHVIRLASFVRLLRSAPYIFVGFHAGVGIRDTPAHENQVSQWALKDCVAVHKLLESSFNDAEAAES